MYGMKNRDLYLSDLPPSCGTAGEPWWRSCCTPRAGAMTLPTYGDVVRHYINAYRPAATAEMELYAGLPSLSAAVDGVGHARTPDGGRHSHQRRIRASVLHRAYVRLSGIRFEQCGTFEDLHDAICGVIGHLHGIGELTVYDTAVRLGAHLGLEPQMVYLHAGTRAGAHALGLTGQRGRLAMSRLPSAFRRLSAREAEDCLCIYKDVLPHARNG